MNDEQRGPWYLVTGLVLGIVIGILYTWLLSPVEYTDTTPSSLRADFKNEYRFMIAAAYAANGDIGRARARLNLLEDGDIATALGAQAQQMLAANAPMDAVRVLANLSEDIQAASAVSPNGTEVPAYPQPVSSSTEQSPTGVETATSTPRPSDTPYPTFTATNTPLPLPSPIATTTPRATRTPSPTPGLPYELTEQTSVCDPDSPALLQIYVQSAERKPAAGVEIIITWNNGQENFFTGFKPDIDPGYADFVMSPNVEYALSLSNGATQVTGLVTTECTAEDGNRYPGSIRLDFQEP